MPCTATKISGPGVVPALGLLATYQILMDTSSLVTGEPVDLTNEFSQVDFASVGASNAIADNAYSYMVVLPDVGTDIAAGTVLISVHQTAATTGATVAASAFEAANAVDLSGVAELRLFAIGKAIS